MTAKDKIKEADLQPRYVAFLQTLDPEHELRPGNLDFMQFISRMAKAFNEQSPELCDVESNGHVRIRDNDAFGVFIEENAVRLENERRKAEEERKAECEPF